MKKIFSAFIALAIGCSAAPPPTPKSHKLSPDAVATTASQITVVIQWNLPLGDLTSDLIGALGGSVVSEFTAVGQGLYNIPSAALSRLGANPLVKYVSPDRVGHAKLAYSAAAVNAPAVWKAGYSGTGIGIAVLDSGINSDDNLGQGKAIVYTQDFTPTGIAGGPSYGADWYGHGQHIAGIIASNGKESLCGKCTQAMVGISPGASLVDLKVLDENGNGSDSQVIAAINQAILLKNVYNIRVMNLSLGRPVFESYTQDPLCQAVEAAWNAGITVVVAAGNDGRDNSSGNQGYGTIEAPGNDPYVITVGAMKAEGTPTRSDDLVASYSSKGPTAFDQIVKPDIVAPGNLVISLLAQHGILPLTTRSGAVPLSAYQTTAPPIGNAPPAQPIPMNPTQQPPQVNFGPGMSQKYFTLSGTSMATAVVSGAAADLLQAYPKLTPDQVKYLMMETAYKTFPTSSTVTDPATGTQYTAYYDVFTVGAGYLDLQATMGAATQAPATGTAHSPTATLDSDGNLLFNFDPTSVWNPASVSGSKAVWSTSSDTANKAVWSTSTDSANKSVWSSKSVWSTSGTTASSTTGAESVAITGEP